MVIRPTLLLAAVVLSGALIGPLGAAATSSGPTAKERSAATIRGHSAGRGASGGRADCEVCKDKPACREERASRGRRALSGRRARQEPPDRPGQAPTAPAMP